MTEQTVAKFAKNLSLFVILFSIHICQSDRVLQITNNCEEPIWVGLNGIYDDDQLPQFWNDDGKLDVQQTENLTLPGDVIGTGVIWARTRCDFSGDTSAPHTCCATGDCGCMKLCQNSDGSKIGPSYGYTAAEFSLFPASDYYDVTTINGFHIPLAMRPVEPYGIVNGVDGPDYLNCGMAGECFTDIEDFGEVLDTCARYNGGQNLIYQVAHYDGNGKYHCTKSDSNSSESVSSILEAEQSARFCVLNDDCADYNYYINYIAANNTTNTSLIAAFFDGFESFEGFDGSDDDLDAFLSDLEMRCVGIDSTVTKYKSFCAGDGQLSSQPTPEQSFRPKYWPQYTECTYDDLTLVTGAYGCPSVGGATCNEENCCYSDPCDCPSNYHCQEGDPDGYCEMWFKCDTSNNGTSVTSSAKSPYIDWPLMMYNAGLNKGTYNFVYDDILNIYQCITTKEQNYSGNYQVVFCPYGYQWDSPAQSDTSTMAMQPNTSTIYYAKLPNTAQLNTSTMQPNITQSNTMQLDSTQLDLDSTHLDSTHLDSTQLDSTQLDGTQLDSTQLDSTQLDSMDTTQLDTRDDREGLDSGSHRIGDIKICCLCMVLLLLLFY